MGRYTTQICIVSAGASEIRRHREIRHGRPIPFLAYTLPLLRPLNSVLIIAPPFSLLYPFFFFFFFFPSLSNFFSLFSLSSDSQVRVLFRLPRVPLRISTCQLGPSLQRSTLQCAIIDIGDISFPFNVIILAALTPSHPYNGLFACSPRPPPLSKPPLKFKSTPSRAIQRFSASSAQEPEFSVSAPPARRASRSRPVCLHRIRRRRECILPKPSSSRHFSPDEHQWHLLLSLWLPNPHTRIRAGVRPSTTIRVSGSDIVPEPAARS